MSALDEENILSPLAARVSGTLACFTRPELKAERFSYPVMTPSAARGVLEAILWKPGMRWRIERIKVLTPIVFTSFRRNEVGTVAAAPSRAVIREGGSYSGLVVEDRRQQRNTVALRDVDYVVETRIELSDQAGPDDNLAKFVDMFRRRLAKGQHFHQPYLGCREFVADVKPVDDDTPLPIQESRDLGIMLWGIEHLPTDSRRERTSITWQRGDKLVHGNARPVFFTARLENGVVEIPPDAAAAEATLRAAYSSTEGGN